MRIKAELVENLLREGKPLPALPTTEEYIQRLQDADYCMSGRHQAQGWIADRSGASRLMREFEYAFISQAARRQIPVHVEEFDGPADCLRVVHSQYGMLLARPDWAVIGRMGHLAVSAVSAGHIKWGGHGQSSVSPEHYRPDVWYLSEACPF